MKTLELPKRGDLVRVGKFRVTDSTGKSLFAKGEVIKDRKGAFWVKDKFEEGRTYVFWIPHKPRPRRMPVKLIEKTPEKLVFKVVARPKQKLQRESSNTQKKRLSPREGEVKRGEEIKPNEYNKPYNPRNPQKGRDWGQIIWISLKLIFVGFFLMMAITSFIEGYPILGIVFLVIMGAILDGGTEKRVHSTILSPWLMMITTWTYCMKKRRTVS